MTTKLTAVALPIGAHYKFDKSVSGSHHLSNETYVRCDGYSEATDGSRIVWEGHERKAVVRVDEVKPEVHSVTAVPEVSITRKRLTIDKIGVGQTFIIHGQPETVYVKISNSHVFNHKRLQMHTTVSERFKQHLNLVAVELVVFNGK